MPVSTLTWILTETPLFTALSESAAQYAVEYAHCETLFSESCPAASGGV